MLAGRTSVYKMLKISYSIQNARQKNTKLSFFKWNIRHDESRSRERKKKKIKVKDFPFFTGKLFERNKVRKKSLSFLFLFLLLFFSF
jgi:hypothetical protein